MKSKIRYYFHYFLAIWRCISPAHISGNNEVDNQNKFSSEPVVLSDIVKEIKDINPNKSSTKDSFLLKMPKITSEAMVTYYKKF